MILPIVAYGDPVLQQEGEEIGHQLRKRRVRPRIPRQLQGVGQVGNWVQSRARLTI